MKTLVFSVLLVASVAFVPSGTTTVHHGSINGPAINGAITNGAIANGAIANGAIINGVDTHASGFETTTVVARNGQLFLR